MATSATGEHEPRREDILAARGARQEPPEEVEHEAEARAGERANSRTPLFKNSNDSQTNEGMKARVMDYQALAKGANNLSWSLKKNEQPSYQSLMSPASNQRFKRRNSRKPAAGRDTAGICSCSVSGLRLGKFLILSSITVMVLILVGRAAYYQIQPSKPNYVAKLRLVSLLARHTDRAPSDALPTGDRHIDKVPLFWPNGLTNLTEPGKTRASRIGSALRTQYSTYLDYNASSYLALSSPSYRCQETMQYLLRGLFTLYTSASEFRLLLQQLDDCQKHASDLRQCKLPSGSGSPNEWRKIAIDTESLPQLSAYSLSDCTNIPPIPIDEDLLLDKNISSLNGIEVLRKEITTRYNVSFGFYAQTIWSTVNSEMFLARSDETLNYTKHFADWIGIQVSSRAGSPIKLLDLFEQSYVYLARDRMEAPVNLLQFSPILRSLIGAQMVALGQETEFVDPIIYKDKRFILYTSHDTVMQRLLFELGIMQTVGSFEDRFHRFYEDDVDKLMAGFKMSHYGMSLEFELWQLELETNQDETNSSDGSFVENNNWTDQISTFAQSEAEAADQHQGRPEKRPKEFPIVQINIYNKEHAEHDPIEFKTIPFGSICRRRFMEKYPKASQLELKRFYSSDFKIDTTKSCPFTLFLNITSDLMIDDKTYQELCHGKAHF